MVLAGTTVSAAPGEGVRSTTRAGSVSTTGSPDDQPLARAASPEASRSGSSGLPHSPSPPGLAGAHSRAGRAGAPGLRGRWGWPLRPQPVVARPFLRPASTYGTGHRGVDLVGVAGQDVLAVEAGTVSHVGRIAGRGTITVLHASGIRSTYEPVEPAVATGAVVAGGVRLGRLEPRGSHCSAAPCLHLGAIRGEVYLDPLTFIVGGRRVRLLPLGQAPEG
jgi:murein DD-endopeptidase MepM/ murein hydrolase activator NlpD